MANNTKLWQRFHDARKNRENVQLMVIGGIVVMALIFVWNVSGAPIFGHYLRGFSILNETQNTKYLAVIEARDDASATKYLAEQRVAYNPYGCAYYVHSNGDIKAPVFTREGPLCDGLRR